MNVMTRPVGIRIWWLTIEMGVLLATLLMTGATAPAYTTMKALHPPSPATERLLKVGAPLILASLLEVD